MPPTPPPTAISTPTPTPTPTATLTATLTPTPTPRAPAPTPAALSPHDPRPDAPPSDRRWLWSFGAHRRAPEPEFVLA
jgi:hypothetical protein